MKMMNLLVKISICFFMSLFQFQAYAGIARSLTGKALKIENGVGFFQTDNRVIEIRFKNLSIDDSKAFKEGIVSKKKITIKLLDDSILN
jgi:hypothetical protein